MLDLDNLLDLPMESVVSVYPRQDIVKPFAFVINLSALEDNASVAIAPGHILRRATGEEIRFTKNLFQSLFGDHFGPRLWETRRPKSSGGKYVRLPQGRWRYFVVEFSADNDHPKLLDEAVTIGTPDLEIGFTYSAATFRGKVVPVCRFRPPRLFQSLSALRSEVDSEGGNTRILTKAEGQQISAVYQKLGAHDHKAFDLRRTLELLFELKDLPHFSPLQILGYFAILESLLTHQPQADDRYDSITRQITQKLALLNRRWQPALDYASFGAATHKKIWSAMYGYRSAIAHGRTPEFKSTLSPLAAAVHANSLIRQAVKQSVRQALVEPQLLADLHDC